MAQIWSDNTLNRLAQLVEEEWSSELNIIVDRCALNIVAGQYDYNLPLYVNNIIRVAWRGYELNPRSRMDQIRSSTTPFATTQSQPREYLVSGMGFYMLRLLPTPNIDLPIPGTTWDNIPGNWDSIGGTFDSPSTPDDGSDLWDPIQYMNACVVEFARVPDVTDESKRIPAFLRRLVFRDEILARALLQEGQGQDLKASQYFAGKSKLMKDILLTIKSNLWLFCPKVMSPDPSKIPRIGRPVLPPNFPAR